MHLLEAYLSRKAFSVLYALMVLRPCIEVATWLSRGDLVTFSILKEIKEPLGVSLFNYNHKFVNACPFAQFLP